jgi:energy-coupling factor transport system permease protein
MSPFLSLAITLLAAIALASLYELAVLATYGIALLFIATVRVKSPRLSWVSLKWTLPFALPMILIHGVINPSYPATSELWGVVPWRNDGLAYGLLTSTRIWIITVVAASWTFVDRDQLIDQMVQWHFPLPVIVMCAQAISTLDFISRRIRAVYLAQQARGIAVGPALADRLRALPTVVIPVVLSTLVDAHARSQCLHTRGLGSGPMRISRSHRVSHTDIAASAILLSIYVLLVTGIHV